MISVVLAGAVVPTLEVGDNVHPLATLCKNPPCFWIVTEEFWSDPVTNHATCAHFALIRILVCYICHVFTPLTLFGSLSDK